jgi:hypothetical protein
MNTKQLRRLLCPNPARQFRPHDVCIGLMVAMKLAASC